LRRGAESHFHDLRFFGLHCGIDALEVLVVRLLHVLLGVLLIVEETCSVFLMRFIVSVRA